MDLHVLHVSEQKPSRIHRDGNKSVISTGYLWHRIRSERLESGQWENTLGEVLESCLPYLNVRDRACYRAVCRAWKRIIDALPKQHFPGKHWLYATPTSSQAQAQAPPAKKSRRLTYTLEQENTHCMDLINLGRLEHPQVKNTSKVSVVVAKHLVGFISKQGVLVFNPLATGPDKCCSRFRLGFSFQPTFVGLHLKTDGSGEFVAVAGCLTSESSSYYNFEGNERLCYEHHLPENLKEVRHGPTGSATFFDGKLYWPSRVGEVVSFDSEKDLWEQLGKPTTSGEDTLLWHQGLFVWSNTLYYLAYVLTPEGKEVNKIWKLVDSVVWEEQEMLPSHPCDAGLPPESEGLVLEIVLVVPWLKGRQTGADHNNISSLHAGVLAFNRSCNKWWWVSHCIHLWQGGGVISVVAPSASVFNGFEPDQVLQLQRPSFVCKERGIKFHEVSLRKNSSKSSPVE